ncbi:MAG TPA: hypothetical protein VHB79_11045 [Polyangiaceae bacterium]|nr:hypothetical protein [Polyangiaceae bacterium]
MSPLSREAILTVLSGLTVLACDKGAGVAAEPAASGIAALAAPASAAAPTASAAAPTASAAVQAKEVPSGQGKAGGAEKSCAPGGCAPGQCGGSKK